MSGLAALADHQPVAAPATGGFVEASGSTGLRQRFTKAQIDAMLPPGGAKGAFTFPAPYNSRGARLTSAADCIGGGDCVSPVGYSYWRNINNHVGSPLMYIVVGLDRLRGGAGPTLISVDKITDEVRTVGPLFDAASAFSYHTTEGWYVVTRITDPLPAMDLNGCPRPFVCPAQAAYLFQPHSSDDDLVHSATVQHAGYAPLGCAVHRESDRTFAYFPTSPGYVFDECHVDKSGRWLMILESSPTGAVNNRVIDLLRGRVTLLNDVDGSLGHLDMGHGYAVGADNYNPLPNATILLKFPIAQTVRPVGPVVHFNKGWDLAAANHVAHGNAKPGIGPAVQYACGSNASRVPSMADEILCFPLDPDRNADTSLDVLVVAQTLTNLDAPGGAGEYERYPKGNLDVTGQYFIWTSNLGGARLDALWAAGTNVQAARIR
jgi:hypothetical protein